MDIFRIEEGIKGLSDVKDSDQKLKIAQGLLKQVQDGERECARDFGIPFDQVSRLRQQIPIIEAITNRLLAGQRKRKENAARAQ